ncbi:hypothetical protein HMP0721_0085 [Pseudoramibacter alactolyticus ATCC 23263]|uniref:Uncharacterized protein n=1 Tax=Pseudoramibacter alactolyticus ATCC 23263 TaxID=887929 RepID=E6MDK3_9FIRM|nr:hypothetical protein HMP0721_0085 [Pseudoramibacter alactolyticus ATCC 23263]
MRRLFPENCFTPAARAKAQKNASLIFLKNKKRAVFNAYFRSAVSLCPTAC